MKFSEYQTKALVHLTPAYEGVNKDLVHGIIGILSEAGELADLLKKMHFHPQKHVDRTNVLDEIGDLMFYIALTIMSIGGTMNEVLDMNLAKLDVRYNKNNGEKNREEEANAQVQASGATTT